MVVTWRMTKVKIRLLQTYSSPWPNGWESRSISSAAAPPQAFEGSRWHDVESSSVAKMAAAREIPMGFWCSAANPVCVVIGDPSKVSHQRHDLWFYVVCRKSDDRLRGLSAHGYL